MWRRSQVHTQHTHTLCCGLPNVLRTAETRQSVPVARRPPSNIQPKSHSNNFVAAFPEHKWKWAGNKLMRRLATVTDRNRRDARNGAMSMNSVANALNHIPLDSCTKLSKEKTNQSRVRGVHRNKARGCSRKITFHIPFHFIREIITSNKFSIRFAYLFAQIMDLFEFIGDGRDMSTEAPTTYSRFASSWKTKPNFMDCFEFTFTL